MKIHQLHIVRHKKAKRIGRGGKRGTTSGRGTKGQKSRAGRRIRPASRDLIIRIPKRKGFRNKPKSDVPLIVSLVTLAAKLQPFASGSTPLAVDREMLRKAGILPKNFRGNVKILGKSIVPFVMTLRGVKASKGAVQSIEQAGGRVE